ncbi:hypothetical protein [Streptosporangium fragile]|uniref:hypothetical protein n=1 Tax=Streptosporangium fragile TaxID=46186 RepID=UPI0031E6CA9E
MAPAVVVPGGRTATERRACSAGASCSCRSLTVTSVTFLPAATGVVAAPAQIVEPFIAVSIVVVALADLLGRGEGIRQVAPADRLRRDPLGRTGIPESGGGPSPFHSRRRRRTATAEKQRGISAGKPMVSR